ncbi:DMT family transporter [Humidisolicoccus flavus]|uniref:DMT family transporter n=1 Tax=Humidisolicoccus flavus TaxID=3111414 RepID=UPI0032442E77
MKSSAFGIVAIIVTSVLWGTTGTAATFAPAVGPLAIGAAAMGVGGILQGAIALRSIRRHAAPLRTHGARVLTGAAAVAIYPLAFYSSMHLSGVAVGTVVSLASAPLASAALERILDGTPLSRRWVIAVTVAIGGSVLLCLARANDPEASAGATALAVVCGLIAGVTYALYSWTARGLMHRGIPRAAAMGSVFGLGGIALVPVLLFTGAPILASSESFLVTAYLAIIPMFLGYVIFGVGLATVRASTATTITLIEPAVAALLAVAVVGETLSALGWFGLGIIGLSLVLLTAPRSARPIPA